MESLSVTASKRIRGILIIIMTESVIANLVTIKELSSKRLKNRLQIVFYVKYNRCRSVIDENLHT